MTIKARSLGDHCHEEQRILQDDDDVDEDDDDDDDDDKDKDKDDEFVCVRQRRQ